mgnify:CR=1 FL=1
MAQILEQHQLNLEKILSISEYGTILEYGTRLVLALLRLMQF